MDEVESAGVKGRSEMKAVSNGQGGRINQEIIRKMP